MNDQELLHKDLNGSSPAEPVGTISRNRDKPAISITQPVFLLALPHSHAAVVCAMLGQHPQMVSLPETHLFIASTLFEWWEMCEKSTFRMSDGLLRGVAQLFFGDQTEDSIKEAEGWLRRRSQFSTGLLYEAIAERARPSLLVESSSTVVFRPPALKRLVRMFPRARFIHLIQHPRGFGQLLMKDIQESSKRGPVPYWMLNLASFPGPSASEDGTPHRDAGFDPQRAWYELNTKVVDFLKPIPERQKLLLHLENLFAQPRQSLRRVVAWLGLRTDDEAIESMLHPEHSPFACFGPPGARYGNESEFLESPTLSEAVGEVHSLEGALSWRQNDQGFLPKVKELARQFGYR